MQIIQKSILLILGVIFSLNAQSFDAVSLGLADNYSAISRGVQAMPWNPANLALKRGNTFELNFVSFNIGLYNNSFSLADYNRYFTEEGHHGQPYPESDKQAILDMIPDEGLKATTNLGMNAFGFAYNNFGLSVQVIQQGQMFSEVSKELVDIALNGPIVTLDYSLHENNPVKGGSFAAMKISAGYGYPLELKFLKKYVSVLAVGVNVNYYLGGAGAKVVNSELKIDRFGAKHDSVAYKARLEALVSTPESAGPTGRGFGIDLGFTAQYEEKWFFSLSFSNLFASIRWTDHIERVVLEQSGNLKLLGETNEDDIVEIDTSYAADPFETKLPSVMRAGASYQLLNNLTLVAEWRQGLDNYFANTTTPRVGVGAEYYPLSWLPLRSGFAVGGNHGFQFGLGTGLHFGFFQMDMSYAVINSLWPGSSEGVFAALGIKLQF